MLCLQPGIAVAEPQGFDQRVEGTRLNAHIGELRAVKLQFVGFASGEHPDMGNITPRILRCINELNSEMNPKDPFTSFRRVHHNAESHRHQMFGALVNKEMEAGDGFPMTGFHPSRLLRGGPIAKYGNVATLENMGEFREYANDLHAAGYFVPKNWTWGMSIRDTVRAWPQR